jgi:hypothetical protein
MKRVFTATCLAATFAVGLAAQSTGTAGSAGTMTSPDSQAQRGGPRTVTGCLRAGDTAGSYTLTDVTMQGASRRGGDPTSTSTGAGTTGSTAAGSTGSTAAGTTGAGTAGATGTDPQSGRTAAPTSIVLNAASDVDLKAHVGHKVEVTGTLAGGRNSATGTGTTGSTTPGTTGGTTTGAGTTGAGSATGTGATAGAESGQARPATRNMTVTSVRMISDSCS